MKLTLLGGVVLWVYLMGGLGNDGQPAKQPAVLTDNLQVPATTVDSREKPQGTKAFSSRGLPFVSGTHAGLVIDVNAGTENQLIHLPGIGPVLAQRIVKYRATHGAFQRVEDLINVSGIGPKRLQQVRPFVMIGGLEAGVKGNS